jgi:hypothetical protein
MGLATLIIGELRSEPLRIASFTLFQVRLPLELKQYVCLFYFYKEINSYIYLLRLRFILVAGATSTSSVSCSFGGVKSFPVYISLLLFLDKIAEVTIIRCNSLFCSKYSTRCFNLSFCSSKNTNLSSSFTKSPKGSAFVSET